LWYCKQQEHQRRVRLYLQALIFPFSSLFTDYGNAEVFFLFCLLSQDEEEEEEEEEDDDDGWKSSRNPAQEQETHRTEFRSDSTLNSGFRLRGLYVDRSSIHVLPLSCSLSRSLLSLSVSVSLCVSQTCKPSLLL